MLLNLVAAKKLDVAEFVTHEFAFDEFEKAYDVFSDAKNTKALKVYVH
jgi:alcohol dehydrogenase